MKKPELSVLMSVYNETSKDITEAIDSVLNQSFTNFEFLIVNDNPAMLDYKTLLDEHQRKDSRIKIINNEENLGLAMSMNKAASIAKADIFVRMDADDISLPTRFEEERSLLLSENFDLVCGRYTVVNEDSQELNAEDVRPEYITSEKIAESLPYKSVIHHPTVMMTRKIFESVKGYRNFPCAQDYDLWLRMLDANATFAMTKQSVLKYRIRSTGVSVAQRMKQRITVEYIRGLFVERLKKGKDSFSKEHYNHYLNQNIHNEKRESELIDEGNKTLTYANDLARQGRAITARLLKLKVWLCNPVYRHVFTKLWISKQQIRRLKR